MFASGVELGANTLRICAAYGPTVCAGCVKDDSIEIIKRSDYGVLKMVENNSVLRVQRKSNARFHFMTMSVMQANGTSQWPLCESIVRVLFVLLQRLHMVVFILLSCLCVISSTIALRIFGQRTNYMPVDKYVRRAVKPLLLPRKGWTDKTPMRRIGLIRHLCRRYF